MTDIDKEMLDNMLSVLDDVTKIQCSDGNWNFDPYMHGMANGLILAQSIFSDKTADFLEKPNMWLEDMPQSDKPEEAV